MGLFIFVLLWICHKPALLLLPGTEVLPFYRLFLIYLLLNMPTYLVENIYLLSSQSKRIFQFGLFSFGGHLIAMILPLQLGYPLAYSFYGLITLATLKHFWLLLLVQRKSKVSFRLDLIRPWIQLSLPLIGYALLGGLMQTYDNWRVNYWYSGDERIFAVFRYGARELPLALALAHAFSTALLPEVRLDLRQALQSIRQKSRLLFHLLFPLSLVLMLTSSWFIPLVFNPEFMDSVPIFNTYLLIIASRLIFSRTVLIGLQDNKVVLWISVLELLTNVIVSIWFISLWGLTGVALATVVAYSLEKALICAYLHKKHQIPVGAYTDLRWWSGYSIILLAVYFIIQGT